MGLVIHDHACFCKQERIRSRRADHFTDATLRLIIHRIEAVHCPEQEHRLNDQNDRSREDALVQSHAEQKQKRRLHHQKNDDHPFHVTDFFLHANCLRWQESDRAGLH